MKIYCYILCLCIGLLACKETDLSSEANISWSENSTQVDASCNLIGLEGENQSSLSRGLVGQITTQELECNFLRIGQNVDGVSPEQYQISTFEKWKGATIVNSEVLSSPDNTADIYFRSIVFYPTQTYDYYDQPIQGVSEFIKELDGIPKYSDIVLVSNDGVNWTERVFIEYIKGATNGVICVAEQTEEMFYRKGCFDIENWKYFRIKPNDDNIIEITMDEIREKFKIKPYKKLSIIDKAK